MLLNKVNMKNPFVKGCIPESMQNKDVTILNKWIWEKENLGVLKEVVKAEEGRLKYFKDSPIINIEELFKMESVIHDKLSSWDREFMDSVMEQDTLSIKQKALCLRIVNGINYSMWKAGLSRAWLQNEYNKRNRTEIDEIIEMLKIPPKQSVIDVENVKEEQLTDETSLIADFKIIKESFDDIMESKLFDHQVARVNFFMTRESGSAIEASSTGTGKTITGLTYSEQLYLERKITHTYIVCPLIMVNVWKNEIVKHTISKDLSKYTIINYEKIPKLMFEDAENSLIIYDEGHKLKNVNGQRFKYISKFKFKYSLPLSATIIGNRIEELGAIYKLINKKLPLNKKTGNIDLKAMKEDLIRISKDKLNLPPLTIKNIPLELDYPKEYNMFRDALYEEIRKDKMLAIKAGKRPPNELVKLLRLNQICSNRNIIMDVEKEFTEFNKFKATMEIINDNPEEQFIIWSNFVPTCKILHEKLSEYYDCCLIYGEVNQNKRDELLEDFKKGKYRILVANPSCLNAGITLVNATRSIFIDRDFSAIKYIQASARFYRIGTTKPCIMYNLYYQDSIEETIIEALKFKEDMLNSILESGQKIDDNIIKNLIKDIYKTTE